MTIWAVLCFVLFLITFFTTKERIQPVAQAKSSIKQDFSDLLKNAPWIALIAYTVFNFAMLAFRGGMPLGNLLAGGIVGGLAATFGVIAGDQVLMWAAVAGVAALLVAYPAAFHAVQWLGAAYLAWLGMRMLLAKAGDAPVLNIRPRQYFGQSLTITLLNPKAIVFYMAFFPLFVDPARHQGLITFGAMAATVAVLTFFYGLTAVLLTHFLAERMRAKPVIGRTLE